MIGRLLCKLGLHKWILHPGTEYVEDKYTEACEAHCGRCGIEGIGRKPR